MEKKRKRSVAKIKIARKKKTTAKSAAAWKEGKTTARRQEIDRLRVEAAKGSDGAARRLAEIYERGEDVQPNLQFANYWRRQAARLAAKKRAAPTNWNNVNDVDRLRVAATKGSVGAARRLVEIYRRGVGVRPNSAIARYWRDKADEWELKIKGKNLSASANPKTERNSDDEGSALNAKAVKRVFKNSVFLIKKRP